MKRLTILITAPTGRVGRKVLAELLAPEFAVRVLTRDPSSLEIRDQIEVITGSADDPVALHRALEGVDALFWCVPAESHETNVRGHHERLALAACQAVRKAGTRRVVTLSVLGEGVASERLVTSAATAMEEILNQSGASIRHVRYARVARGSAMASGIEQEVTEKTEEEAADAALRWLVRRDWEGIEWVAAGAGAVEVPVSAS